MSELISNELIIQGSTEDIIKFRREYFKDNEWLVPHRDKVIELKTD